MFRLNLTILYSICSTISRLISLLLRRRYRRWVLPKNYKPSISAFCCIAVTSILVHLPLLLPAILASLPVAQCRASQTDLMLLAEGRVCSGLEDLVSQNSLWITSKLPEVILSRCNQVTPYDEITPAGLLQKGKSIHHRKMQGYDRILLDSDAFHGLLGRHRAVPDERPCLQIYACAYRTSASAAHKQEKFKLRPLQGSAYENAPSWMPYNTSGFPKQGSKF